MEQKYLGQIIKEEGIELDSNTIIIAPTGSGKTHYILNDLCVGKNALYLCDTGNLKDSVKNAISEEELQDLLYHIDVMCYAEFGLRVMYDTNDKFINGYDLIVCDEVHNLIDYTTFGKDKSSLQIARLKLFQKHENTQIVFFTATPYYLDKLATKYKGVDVNFKTYNFTKRDDINRYINRRKGYINNISQIQFALKEYEESFRYRGMKCLIYTKQIGDMNSIAEMCEKNNLNPICIWSTNATVSMTDEQIRVREYLLKHGELAEPYNVLIINRATETGVNIYDEHMNLVIVNTINITEQIQARGRVRHDVDLLVVKTKYKEQVGFKFIIDEVYLNKAMTKKEVEENIIKTHSIRDEKSRLYSVNKLSKALELSGYKMETKRQTINGNKITVYTITKK